MATIAGLYIGLFGRPADPRGLAYFNAATGNGADLSAIGPLENTAEYQTRFAGWTTTQVIQSIHQSLFNRDADPQDFTHFAEAVSAGTLTINRLAFAIIDSARGNDLAILTTKLAAANAFTAAIDTEAEILGYDGSAAGNVARAFLASIETTIPAKSTIDNAVLRATGTGEIVTLTAPPAVTLASFAGTAAMPPGMLTGQVSHYQATTDDYGLAPAGGAEDLGGWGTLGLLNVSPAPDLPADMLWIA